MKNVIPTLVLIVIMSACGGSPSSKESSKEDDQIAEEIIESIEKEKTILSEKTNETLSEVDSLLENL